MNLEVTIKLDSEALSAINNLSAAIRSVGSVPQTVSTTVTASSTGSDSESEDDAGGPVHWADNSTGKFGVVDTEAAYATLKKKNKNVYKITEDVHAKKVAEAVAAEVKKTEKKTETKTETKKVEKKPAAAASSDEELTIEDVVATFTSYLSKDLDADERKARAGFVKPMLKRFGASKASELDEEHFALAINLVKRKMAGEDIDPETAEFEEIEEDGLV